MLPVEPQFMTTHVSATEALPELLPTTDMIKHKAVSKFTENLFRRTLMLGQWLDKLQQAEKMYLVGGGDDHTACTFFTQMAVWHQQVF